MSNKSDDMHGCWRTVYLRNITAAAIAFVGLFNLLVTMRILHLPPSATELRIIPPEFLFKSHVLESLISIILLISALHLIRGKKSACYFCMGALAISLLLHSFHRHSLVEFVLPAILLTILIIQRDTYTVKGVFGQSFSRREIGYLFFTGCAIFLVSFAAFYIQRGRFIPSPGFHGSIILSFMSSLLLDTTTLYRPITHTATMLIESVTVSWVTFYSYLSYSIFSRIWSAKRTALVHSKEHLDRVMKRYGCESQHCFALHPDKEIYLVEDQVFLSYKIVNGVGVVLGGPIGSPTGRKKAIRRYSQFCRENDIIPAFYGFTENELNHYTSLGMRIVKIGEEGVIDPHTFSLKGPRMKNLRNSVTHAERLGVMVSIARNRGELGADVLNRLSVVSSDWNAARTNAGFSCTPFDPNFLLGNSDEFLILGYYKGEISAFLTLRTYPNKRGATLDIMRRMKGGPNGITELMMTRAISYLSVNFPEITELSLGLAGLSDSLQQMGDHGLVERMLFFVGLHLNTFYGYQSLFSFKNKFDPKWRARYLSIPNSLVLSKVLYSIYKAHVLPVPLNRNHS
ncbi:MAG: DUF2156 domain-containing protein [Thaumarchaeota archaeon]|nr:DUF2156 domain-containing protein [Nitrososphaerota archaeon]